MIRHLIKKELRQHASALAILFLVQLSTFGLQLFVLRREGSDITELNVYRTQLVFFSPIAAHLSGHLLFTRELRGQTILFLEALPVGRASVVIAKLLVFAAVQLLVVSIAFAGATIAASSRELLEPTFLGLILARGLALMAAVWGLTLFGAVIGRYTIPLYLSLLVLLFALAPEGSEVGQLGPLPLLEQRMVIDREHVPWTAFAWAGAIFVAGNVASLLVLFAREGTVALLIGERMSHTEKIVIACVFVGLVIGSYSFNEKRPKKPYQLTGLEVVERAGRRVRVQLEPGGTPAPRATALAGAIYAATSTLADKLQIDQLPPLFVVHTDKIDEDHFETGRVREREGQLIRANLRSADSDLSALLVFVARRALSGHTVGRADLEARRWVRDGYAELRVGAPALPGRQERLTLRALYAVELGWSLEDLLRYDVLEEQLGPELAGAIAWSALRVLEEQLGPEGVDTWARGLIGRRLDCNAWSAWSDRRAGNGGLDWARLRAGWDAWVARERAPRESALALLPKLTGQVRATAPSALTRFVDYEVEVLQGSVRRFSILYDSLYAIDGPLDPEALEREDLDYPDSKSGRLTRSYSAGDRVFVSFAFRIPALGCEVRQGAGRRVLE